MCYLRLFGHLYTRLIPAHESAETQAQLKQLMSDLQSTTRALQTLCGHIKVLTFPVTKEVPSKPGKPEFSRTLCGTFICSLGGFRPHIEFPKFPDRSISPPTPRFSCLTLDGLLPLLLHVWVSSGFRPRARHRVWPPFRQKIQIPPLPLPFGAVREGLIIHTCAAHEARSGGVLKSVRLPCLRIFC